MKGDIEVVGVMLAYFTAVFVIVLVAPFIQQLDFLDDLSTTIEDSKGEFRAHSTMASIRSDERLINETNEQALRLDILQNRKLIAGSNYGPPSTIKDEYTEIQMKAKTENTLETNSTSNNPVYFWNLTDHRKRIFELEFRPIDVKREVWFERGYERHRRNFSAGKLEISVNDRKVGAVSWTNLNQSRSSNYSLRNGPRAGPMLFSASGLYPYWNTGRTWSIGLNMKNKKISLKPVSGRRIEKKLKSIDSFRNLSLNLSMNSSANYARVDVEKAEVTNSVNLSRTRKMLNNSFENYVLEIQKKETGWDTIRKIESSRGVRKYYSEVYVARPSEKMHRISLGIGDSR